MREAKHSTVVVTDGYEATRALLRLWLEAEGFGVAEAGDGQVAFELTCPVSQPDPDLGKDAGARRGRSLAAHPPKR